MARFHDLTVTDIRKTIREAVVVTLAPAPGEADLFAFEPGQYLTFRHVLGGETLRRSYSICSGLDDGVLQVGIKAVAGGAFSSFANDALAVGDRLSAMPPAGRFVPRIEPARAWHRIGFAGGSGITPILSILRSTLSREPLSRFTLVYANRGAGSVMFREEIEDLKNLYMDRLAIVHVLETDAQEIDLFSGRVTEEKCADLFRCWIEPTRLDEAFICGPEPMMQGIVRALEAHGMARDRIRFELFSAAQPGRLPRPASAGPDATAKLCRIEITLDGVTRRIEAPPDTTLLEAALSQSLDAPFACKAGVCSTCRCRVLSGAVEMAANHALEDDEVSAGYALACQSRPVSDAVAVSFDL